MTDQLFQLKGGFQNYGWGKLGDTSSVAKFSVASDKTIQIDEQLPYAELWMGTHPKVPSYNLSNGKTLKEIIESNPEKYLGEKVAKKYGGKLPFLFKVLSIAKVLSIQAHPDKKLAEQLHAKDSKNYPDDNHKPEMAIAITDFEGFCGFRPLEDIAECIGKVKQLHDILGDELSTKFIRGIHTTKDIEEGDPKDVENRKLLQEVFEKIMRTDDAEITKEAASLVETAKSDPELLGAKLSSLILRLDEQFPNDIGLLCGALLLNYVTLVPGEAVFLKAKDPHAYISGDIIECMAASDNVVRAGFTPKFKDVDNLVSMLTYSYDPVEKQKMVAKSFDARSSGDGRAELYDPPIDEFTVLRTDLSQHKGNKRHFEAINGPSILIVTEGSGDVVESETSKLSLIEGNICFIAPGTPVDLTAESDKFVSYRAYVEC